MYSVLMLSLLLLLYHPWPLRPLGVVICIVELAIRRQLVVVLTTQEESQHV